MITSWTYGRIIGFRCIHTGACGAIIQHSRSFSYGQPVPESHPELLGRHELTPGITAHEYWRRRHALSELMAPGSIAILPAASLNYMAGIIPYPYRPDADLMYITGVMQPGVVAVLQAGVGGQESTAGNSSTRLILFIEEPNHERDRWDGARLDREAALEIFGAEEVHYASEMPRKLSQYAASALTHSGTVYFDLDRATSYKHPEVISTLSRVVATHGSNSNSNCVDRTTFKGPHSSSGGAATALSAAGLDPAMSSVVTSLRPLLHEMRLVKSEAEATLMRRSAETAASGLVRCIGGTRPGVGEWELAAAFVVASGPDAYYTHYGRNDKVLQAGQLVLMDAGCERHGYASDVTRTWPINGKFSAPQRDVYDLVLHVHKKCLDACKPGSSIRNLHALSTSLMSEGIRDLGLCGKAPLHDIASRTYSQFYWHSVGHFLGMDTHDVPLVSHSRKMVPGSIITIEPGLYIPDEERFGALRGIGVRIEDDVLVTPDGNEVLSSGVPTARDEIEAMVGSRSSLV